MRAKLVLKQGFGCLAVNDCVDLGCDVGNMQECYDHYSVNSAVVEKPAGFGHDGEDAPVEEED